MPRGASPKREHEFEKLKHQFQHNAHTGNPRLSVKEYAGLTIPEVTSRLASLSLSQIRRLRDYELAHKHRKGMLEKLNRKLVH